MITSGEPEYESVKLRDLMVQLVSGRDLYITMEDEDILIVDEKSWDITLTTPGRGGKLVVQGNQIEYYKVDERMHKRQKK